MFSVVSNSLLASRSTRLTVNCLSFRRDSLVDPDEEDDGVLEAGREPRQKIAHPFGIGASKLDVSEFNGTYKTVIRSSYRMWACQILSSRFSENRTVDKPLLY